MASLVRCPGCSTFVKAVSIDEGSCPFCSTAVAASRRNPIPGIVLAAAIAAAPSCHKTPVYGVAPETDAAAADAGVDAGPADSGTGDAMGDSPDAAPIYGVAPESE